SIPASPTCTPGSPSILRIEPDRKKRRIAPTKPENPHREIVRTHENPDPHPPPVREQRARPPRGHPAGVRRAGHGPGRRDPRRTPVRHPPAAARAGRAGPGPALYEPLDAEHVDRHEFLSPGVVYDEVQPQAERAPGHPAGDGRGPSLSAGSDGPGDARAALADA